MFIRRLSPLLVALCLAVTACTAGGTDTTVGTTTPPPTATSAPTTVATLPPSTIQPSTTTTEAPPPTTIDPEVRLQQIVELVHKTEVARWMAVYDDDYEQLAALAGTQEIWDFGLRQFDRYEDSDFLNPPTLANVTIEINEVLEDRADCLVVDMSLTLGDVIDGLQGTSTLITVYWPTEAGLKIALGYDVTTPRSLWIGDCDLAIRDFEPDLPES